MAYRKRLEVHIMTMTLLGNSLSLISVIGILSAMVMIITEMIKDLWIIKKIPTKLTVLAISLVVVTGAMIIYLNCAEEAFVWWYLVAAFFAAFVVGYLSMNGWDALYDIWSRYVPSKNEGGETDNDRH